MSYFPNTGRIPNWRYLCIHFFWSPCNYAPMDGPVHKRAALIGEGYFVGTQRHMALVIRKKDMELIYVLSKKIKVYESAYIAPLESKPTAEFAHAEIVKEPDEASTPSKCDVPETRTRLIQMC